MDGQNGENIILFPKTVEYYQAELTRMLETERYGQAIRMLRFLLACQSGNPEAQHEWQSLLQWLEMMFPEETIEGTFEGSWGEEEPEPTEDDLLQSTVRQKAESDRQYAKKLLAALTQTGSADKQMLALDQLAYIGSADIDDEVKRWLESDEMHPAVQFKALQVLKKRGATGLIELDKWNEKVLLDLEDTPASMDDFPAQIREIVLRVQEISEVSQPMLSYFAEETWRDFLACVYGTSMYRQMLKQDADTVDVWASALHLVLQEAMFQHADKDEIFDMYGITSHMAFAWEQAYRIIKMYMRTIGPPNV
ncbi:hypothetical protein [Paenibacillus hamazuiensis]|uniref:hypothetical protein n=1 Tax=Paenibacillus hamazuiensis TaxID=2936508 RepID=UPI00200D6686|nr:hypothetical protein [Paenibacillus hamazuiensis]